MDENLRNVYRKKANKVIGELEKNNINGYLVENRDDVSSIIDNIVEEDSKVTVGGSVTLFETGVIDKLRSGKYDFLDRYDPKLSKDQVRDIYREAFFSDVYFTGLNAITEDGTIYNVDGNGNRVAAIIFGPKKVIFVTGVNKIVKDLNAAIERNRSIAAPTNNIRLEKNTPCRELGYCVDCNSEDRICNKYSLIKKESDKDRMHVIIVNENLGY